VMIEAAIGDFNPAAANTCSMGATAAQSIVKLSQAGALARDQSFQPRPKPQALKPNQEHYLARHTAPWVWRQSVQEMPPQTDSEALSATNNTYDAYTAH
jgi:hypothetical protein